MLHVSLVVHTIFVSRYYYKEEKKKIEVEKDVEQTVIEGEIIKKLLKLLLMYADCTKIMLVKPVWFFTCK